MLRWLRSPLAPTVLGLAVASAGCSPNPKAPEVGAQLFSSPQVNAVALANDQGKLVVANTTSATVSVFDTASLPGDPDGALLGEIAVGIDPVGIAIRPAANPGEPELALVTNHISDSISVIDLAKLGVVQTLQELDADGVTTTDAPTGVVFAGPQRAFVALDDRNEVLVIDFDAGGHASINPERLQITAQAPRALAVVGDRLLVGAFESGNETEFPNCGPLDTTATRPFLPGDPWDEGCQFYNRFLETLIVNDIFTGDIDLEFGVIVDFAARNPNIGGEVIVDRDRPDRDVFVFDVNSLGAPLQVIEGVSTLIYGLEASGQRVWVTSTNGRNDLDGLEALDNRMFENRLSFFDCTPACGPIQQVDLDANPWGVPVPTPYGARASANGQSLVLSVAGSDGIPGLAEDPTTDIPGLVTTDANGNVLGHVPTGAIPQSLALASDAAGNAQTAYVLNTVDSTVSVVDVSDLANPRVLTTFEVGDDPTPPLIRQGRALFMSARASTKGTFSCESCHPNANTDQLIWTINSLAAPQDFDPACDPFAAPCPEPRTTQPIRGLRDTLPLHWMGSLADPFPNQDGQLFQPEDDGAPDCDIAIEGEVGCARHLVNASLSGVMCDQAGGCAPGPTGLPGALREDERDALAAFMMSVSYPPSPTRRPDDALSPIAIQGVADFFTDEDGLGVGSAALGVGQAVGFAPITCADNSGGCHALPLGASTNSLTVGGFDAPTMRGLWDRHVEFSNGNTSSEEVLVASQDCADGNPPGDHPVLGAFLRGDPCALESPAIEALLGFTLDPFDGVPSGVEIYDPAVGITERGVFLAGFESIFHIAYGVRGESMWEFFQEMSVGFPGLYGRQLTVDESDALSLATDQALEPLLAAAEDGKLALRASFLGDWTYAYDPDEQRWHHVGLPDGNTHNGWTTEQLLQQVMFVKQSLTFTAHLRSGVTIGGADRQPLLHVDPDRKVSEQIGDLLAIPRPAPEPNQTFRIGGLYVDPAAKILLNGSVCPDCSFVMGSTSNGTYLDVTIVDALPLGTHVLQVLNPDGWSSNEMPLQVEFPPPPFVGVPDETQQCIADSGCLLSPDPLSCAFLFGCEPLPGEITCGPADGLLDCNSCTLTPDCSDGSCTPVPATLLVPTAPNGCTVDTGS
jgi:DNA-binding beta-propeller fold protein YncE